MNTIELQQGTVIGSKQDILKQDIRKRIQSGEYFDKLPNTKDLVEEHKVNYRTIRKALNALVKDDVITASRRREGFFVNEHRHYCIGIIGYYAQEGLFFKGEYFSSVFEGILPVIEKKGDYFSYQRKKENIPYKNLFKSFANVNGVLMVVPILEDNEKLTRLISASKTPVIVIGGTYFTDRINYVDSDNVGDTMLAVEHFIARGHRRIAFVCNLPSASSQVRLNGYKRALDKYAIDFDASLIVMEIPSGEEFKKKIRGIFSSPNPPEAIFGANFVAAERALEIIGEKRNHLDVVTYDDFGDALGRFNIPYGVVTQPLSDIGRTAIIKLNELIEGKTQPPIQVKLPSKLIFKHAHGTRKE